MEATHTLRCLGLPALHAPSGDLVRFRTKKHLALLVYLAVEPRAAHRRERLADLLWPNATPAEGRHSLATALSVLRAKLGRRAFETGRDHIRLAAPTLGLDLDRLAAGEVVGGEFVPPLEVAGFLDGFDIPDAPEFMLWKDRQHARWLPAIKEALIRLMDLGRRTGGSRQMELLADRMLALDELSEEAIRAKMEARAFAGDRLTALKIFEEWKVKLAEELGAAPSDLVEGIALRLRRRGWERTTASNIPTVRTDQWRNRAFVGRSAEHRVLYEAWERTRQSTPGHGLVLGDSGIGKTTLVERLTTVAGLEGAAVSRVQCYDLEREIPYATLGSLVQGLLTAPGVSGTPPEALAELARTIPEVRHRFPVLPPAVESQGETARIRLTEAVHQLLGSIAEEHPVILVVDDLHLADDASLAVLHLVMRKATGQPIMVIFTARPGELRQSPQASRLREAGPALGLVEVELAPLTEDESLEMLESLVATDRTRPGATVRRTLVRAARGYPMVLELLVQDWQAHGDQSLALSVDAMTAELGVPGIPAAAYRQILDRLISGLDVTTSSVLNLASLLGHRLNELTMFTLVDLTVGQTLTGMNRLASLRILRDGGDGLEFTNELVRAHVYLGVPSTVRRALHGGIADLLIAAAETGKPALALEIAWHCFRAGRRDQAMPYLLEGAWEALQSGAPQVSERALSTALPSLSGSFRRRAVLLLGETLQEQGQWAESLEVLDRALHFLEDVDQDEVTVLRAFAEVNLSDKSEQESLRYLDQLGRIAADAANSRTRARAARTAAYVIGGLRAPDLAQELLQIVETIPHADLDNEIRGVLALTRASLLYQTRQRAASLREAAAAIEELKTKQVANSVLAQLQCGKGSIECAGGRYAEAIGHFVEALRLAVRLGNDSLTGSVNANIALCYGRLGNYTEQLRYSQAALSTARSGLLAAYDEVLATYCAAFSWAMRGYLEEPRALVATLDGKLSPAAPRWMRQAWQLFSADALLAAGDAALAYSHARRALQMAPTGPLSNAYAGPYARWVTLLSIADKNPASAKTALLSLADELDRLDAIDQIEVLCALLKVEGKPALSNERLRGMVQEKLAALPPAIGEQLVRLRMVES